MTFLISGGAKNGKSGMAQDLAVELAAGGTHYYLATMIPVDEEDRERIRRHVADRAGMGFETIECGRDFAASLEGVDLDATFLLDSVTAQLMNVLFDPEKNYALDIPAAERCADQLEDFARKAGNVVFVSDNISSDALRYDESTETYRRLLAQIDRRLARACDVVAEVNAGQVTVYKGAWRP